MRGWFFLLYLALFAAYASATPVSFNGTGWVNGNDTWYDLYGNNFHWHISGDIGSGAAGCLVETPCDLSFSVFADSLSDVTSVYGTYNGKSWGMFPQHVFSSLDVNQQGTLGADVQVGARLSVPVEVLGTITGPNLQLQFAGQGIDNKILVFSRDGRDVTVLFGGPFEFSGTLVEVPEPSAWRLAAAGLLLFACRRWGAGQVRARLS